MSLVVRLRRSEIETFDLVIAQLADVGQPGRDRQLASYNSGSLGQRPHQAVIQSKQERRADDALQGCHWTVSLLKRWRARHACRLGEAKAPASLPRRVRLPLQPV